MSSAAEMEIEAWVNQANCLGIEPEAFFPELGADSEEAKAVCQGCLVRGDCGEYALNNGEKFGIWGGLDERERRRIRRDRALAQAVLAVSNLPDDTDVQQR